MWLLLACSGPDDEAAPPTEVAVTDFTVAPREGQLFQAELAATLSEAVPVVFVCTADDDPEEAFLAEPEASLTPTAVFRGLAAERPYTCVVRAADGAALRGVTRRPLELDRLPSYFPDLVVDGEGPLAGGAYTLFNEQRYCDGGRGRLLIVDPEGRFRWMYELPTGVDMGIEARPTPDGTVVWGGGGNPMGATTEVDLDGNVLRRVAFPASDGVFFHHDGKRLPDGRLLTLETVSNTSEGGDVTGFRLRRFGTDGAQDWDWNSQQALDAGTLPPGEGDIWHANWVDIVDDVAWVSLCLATEVLAIDLSTGEVTDRLGRDGDWALVDPAGTPLTDADWFQCQHGLEVDGDELLVYDNGRDRQASRIASYTLDHATRTATLAWTWHGPGWFENILGDVDALPDEHMLVDVAHCECQSSTRGTTGSVWEVDKASGEIVWSVGFTDPMEAGYRAERVESCFFGNTKWCDVTAARLAALGG